MSTEWGTYMAFGTLKTNTAKPIETKTYIASETEKEFGKYLTNTIVTDKRALDTSSRAGIPSVALVPITLDYYLARGVGKLSGIKNDQPIVTVKPDSSISFGRYLVTGVVKNEIIYEDVKRPDVPKASKDIRAPMLYAHYLANGMSKLELLPKDVCTEVIQKKKPEINIGSYLTKTVVNDSRDVVTCSLPPVTKSSEPTTYAQYMAYGLNNKSQTASSAAIAPPAQVAATSVVAKSVVDINNTIDFGTYIAFGTSKPGASKPIETKTYTASATEKEWGKYLSAIMTTEKRVFHSFARPDMSSLELAPITFDTYLARGVGNAVQHVTGTKNDTTAAAKPVSTASSITPATAPSTQASVSVSTPPVAAAAASVPAAARAKTEEQLETDKKIESFGTKVKNLFSSVFSSTPKK